MKVSEIMTPNPACCSPETPIIEVARMMVDHDCGEIPVAATNGASRLVGVVTDRDIVCRVVAEGRDPQAATARECMSSPAVNVAPDASLDEALSLMEDHQIRRLPVVNAAGECVGIVSQADVAMRAPAGQTAELVREVSRH